MAQGGADPGVGARAQGGDPPAHRRVQALVEALDGRHLDRLAPAAGEGQDRERVAAGLEPEGEGGERRLLDVEHAPALDPGVGRERGVDQDGDGEVARAVAGLEVDAVASRRAGGEVGAGADQRVHVELAAVGLGAQDLAPRPQRLEPAPDQTDVASRRGVGRPVLAGLGRRCRPGPRSGRAR